MSQILHIFRKDIRRHWPEITLSLAILAGFAWNAVTMNRFGDSWEDFYRSYFFHNLMNSWLAPLVAVGWVVLIVRVVHGESLVGDRQFWVTRPYQWKKLLAAKALFVALFINLPLLIMQIVLLSQADFTPAHYVKGLLWVQCLWCMILIVPAATLAVITPGFGQAALVALGVLLSGIALISLSLFGLDVRYQVAKGVPGWLPWTIVLGACLAAILWQYSRRRASQSRWMLAAAVVLALVVLVAAGKPFQADLYPQPSSQQAAPVQIRFNTSNHHAPSYAIAANKVPIQLPLLISGIAPHSAVAIDAMQVEIDVSGGRHWNSGWFPMSQLLQPEEDSTVTSFFIDRAFFEQVKAEPASMKVSFALTELRPGETDRIPVSAAIFSGPHDIRCFLNSSDLECNSPLRVPFFLATTVSDESTCPVEEGTKAALPGMVFYTLPLASWRSDVMPAVFALNPVRRFPLNFSAKQRSFAKVCPGTPLIFDSPRPSGRTRTELTVQHIVLGAYAPEIRQPDGEKRLIERH